MKELLVGAILVLITMADLTSSDKDTDDEPTYKNGYDYFRRRIKRWQCDSGFGFNRFNDYAGGSLLGGFGGGNLGDIDPTTFVLLALLGGAGNSPVSPVPVSNSGSTEDTKLIPLPPSGQQKSPTTEAPTTKAVEDFLNDELSFGLKPQQSPPIDQPTGENDEKKARGHVTPGNRCEDDSECVAHAECVEALRQKYCVCLPGRRPKGGVCV